MPGIKKYFLPIDPEKHRDIERATPRESHKGAFTPVARLSLAKAVKAKKPSCTMDNRLMAIRYRDRGVFIKPLLGGSLPCGEFSYEVLTDHIKVAKEK